MKSVEKARQRLVEAGGNISQDLGLGRIVGQILIYLYLSPREVSLGEIGTSLGLSKASVSIAARQLESYGMIRRVWKKGDRQSYYRTTENIALALQHGIATFLRQRLLMFGSELDSAMELLAESETSLSSTEDIDFCRKRVARARQLQHRLEQVIDNPLVKLIGSTINERK
jgi:DNA-binding transcriptional regulator GbsR (MarR family)